MPDEVAETDPHFHDFKGKLIPEKQWNEQYGVCSYCTGFVNPEQAFRFTTEGETLCHVCAEDPDVQTYVNLK